MAARIILIADTFDSITSDRSYRRARSVEYAVAQLRANAGTQFDPRGVEAFLRLLADKKIYRDASLAGSGEPAPAGAGAERRG
jgi:HD-GYP domain-containing protein (c-di-GMP phosphodiesterase class II)